MSSVVNSSNTEDEPAIVIGVQVLETKGIVTWFVI